MDSAPGNWPYDQLQDYSLSQVHSRRWKSKDILFERNHERQRPRDVEETGINTDKAKYTYWVTALS